MPNKMPSGNSIAAIVAIYAPAAQGWSTDMPVVHLPPFPAKMHVLLATLTIFAPFHTIQVR
jgi:hypothetical protein